MDAQDRILPDTARAAFPLSLAVALMAGAVLVIEVLQHQALAFFTDYLLANLAINSALSGMAAGSLAALLSDGERRAGWLVGAPLAVMASMWAGFAYLATQPFHSVAGGVLLALPHAVISFYLSVLYRREAPAWVYGVSLTGAAVGVIAIGAGFDRFGLEAVALFTSLAMIVAARAGLALAPAGAPPRLGLLLGLLGAMLATACLASLKWQPVSLSTWSALYGTDGQSRVHDIFDGHLGDLAFSRWNLEGRIDIFRVEDIWRTLINSWPQDTITRAPRQPFDDVDPRFPPVDIDTAGNALICGSSAEGVVKLVRPLMKGRVFGVELNGAAIEAMLGPFWDASDRAYQGVDVRVMDARSFVDGCREKLGLITLMSVHPPGRPIGIPEYLFTREAFDRYFRLLGDDGVINIEETAARNGGEGAAGMLRVVACVAAGLERAGADPRRSMVLYRWQLADNYVYVHILARTKPFSDAEMQRVGEWMKRTDRLLPRRRGLIHDPSAPGPGPGERLTAWLGTYLTVPLPADRRTDATTDDHPYLSPAVHRMEPEWQVFHAAVWLAAPWAVLSLALFLAGWKERRGRGLRWLCGLALLGTAYLMVEMHFIHRLHLFLGSHSRSFILVLAGLFFASSLGAMYGAPRFRGRRGLVAIGVLVALVAGEAALRWVLPAAESLPARWLAAVAVLFPVGFAMGMPFPLALDAAREELSARFVPLALAANNALSVVGTGLHLVITVQLGMSAIFLVAVSTYAVALALLGGDSGAA
jgi:hypothetical protein